MTGFFFFSISQTKERDAAAAAGGVDPSKPKSKAMRDAERKEARAAKAAKDKAEEEASLAHTHAFLPTFPTRLLHIFPHIYITGFVLSIRQHRPRPRGKRRPRSWHTQRPRLSSRRSDRQVSHKSHASLFFQSIMLPLFPSSSMTTPRALFQIRLRQASGQPHQSIPITKIQLTNPIDHPSSIPHQFSLHAAYSFSNSNLAGHRGDARAHITSRKGSDRRACDTH